MIYFVILLFGLLLAGNYYAAKSVLYPPTLFALVWFTSLLGLLLSGDTFYPVSGETLMVYFFGAVAFSTGGIVALTTMSRESSQQPLSVDQIVRLRRLLDLFLIILVVGLLFYWQQTMAGIADGNDEALQALSRERARASGETTTFEFVRNLPILSGFVGSAMFLENDGTWARRWRVYVAIIVALVYGALTGSKGGAVWLVLTLLFIDFIRKGAVNLKWAAISIFSVVVAFSAGLMVINFAYTRFYGLGQLLESILETIQNYWLGGLVAFGRVVADPYGIESVQGIERFFLQTMNSLGAEFYVPSFHAEFTNISPSQTSNTYTIYFSYFKDFGWIGTGLIMLLLGLCLTWIYGRAKRGKLISIMVYAASAVGIVFTFNGEHFITGLNGYIKMVLFYSFLYYFPRMSLGGREFAAKSNA